MASENIKSEIEQLKTNLKIITDQRNELISNIRAKYREMVKNSDDALKYVGEYIKLSISFHSWQIECEDSYCINLFKNNYNADDIVKLFKELCNPYIRTIDYFHEYDSFAIIFERM